MRSVPWSAKGYGTHSPTLYQILSPLNTLIRATGKLAVVLNRDFSDHVFVRPKRHEKLPYVLSKDEILSILDHVSNLKHKTVLLTIYSSGL
ncbi:MAG: hypothetical protein PHD60_09445, partial [Clostridia bacterium]|nr:hypothetical protein [Clostridia bacterium]